MEDNSPIIRQVGFKMTEFERNTIKSRAAASGVDMQDLITKDIIAPYFANNPLTEHETKILESYKK